MQCLRDQRLRLFEPCHTRTGADTNTVTTTCASPRSIHNIPSSSTALAILAGIWPVSNPIALTKPTCHPRVQSPPCRLAATLAQTSKSLHCPALLLPQVQQLSYYHNTASVYWYIHMHPVQHYLCTSAALAYHTLMHTHDKSKPAPSQLACHRLPCRRYRILPYPAVPCPAAKQLDFASHVSAGATNSIPARSNTT